MPSQQAFTRTEKARRLELCQRGAGDPVSAHGPLETVESGQDIHTGVGAIDFRVG